MSPAERQLLREAMESARGLKRRDDRSGVLAIAEGMLTAKHAESVKAFAGAHGIDLSAVDVAGFHGQTVIHCPERGLTVQLGDGRALSAALGIPVVYDFRATDVEHGGQGAPARAGLPPRARPVCEASAAGCLRQYWRDLERDLRAARVRTAA